MIRPPMKSALDRLSGVPVDIEPIFSFKDEVGSSDPLSTRVAASATLTSDSEVPDADEHYPIIPRPHYLSTR